MVQTPKGQMNAEEFKAKLDEIRARAVSQERQLIESMTDQGWVRVETSYGINEEFCGVTDCLVSPSLAALIGVTSYSSADEIEKAWHVWDGEYEQESDEIINL